MNAVLLAEPEPTTRGFLERHLREDGFEVVQAEDGEALDLVERRQPDVVLVSDALAHELCRRLREGEPGRSWDRQLPVIVLGRQESDPVDCVRAFARGCDDFVSRPFHYDELVARIRADEPFVSFEAILFASPFQAVQLTKVTSSVQSSAPAFRYARFAAMEKRTPFPSAMLSGSRVRRPVRQTAFTSDTVYLLVVVGRVEKDASGGGGRL